MVGTTIRAALAEGKTMCLLSPIAFALPLIVVFIVLRRQGHPLHKGPVGGWIRRVVVVGQKNLTPFPFSFPSNDLTTYVNV